MLGLGACGSTLQSQSGVCGDGWLSCMQRPMCRMGEDGERDASRYNSLAVLRRYGALLVKASRRLVD